MSDEMKQFYVKWEGRTDPPVLAMGCTTPREAALWAINNDLPLNATRDSHIHVFVASPELGTISDVKLKPPSATFRAGSFAGEREHQ